MSSHRPFSIMYVAYPLLAVTPESAGGAEQMLLTLEAAIAARGHRATVAASAESRVHGHLLATGEAANGPDQYEEREREHVARVLEYLRHHPGEFDLVHDKSGSFFRHAGECPVPVLATLHLPRSFYPASAFESLASNVCFNCVSHSQAKSFVALPSLLGVVENGIDVERFAFTEKKQKYLLWLGRICEEKAPHLAIEVAVQARLPLVLAGQVYPFRYHQDYFNREVRPHLDGKSRVRFVESPLAEQKLDLLRHARALLLTSKAEETSSLVAMEAMACGTPVVASRCGAFPEVVAHGETGFLTSNVDEMVDAIARIDEIRPEACRLLTERRFTASRMAAHYERLYSDVIARAANRAAA